MPVVEPAAWSSEPTNAAAPSSEASAAVGATPSSLTGFNPLPLSATATYTDDTLLHPLLATLNFGALATVSNGYSVGSIKRAVRMTCTLRRLDALPSRPLEEMDFVNALARCERIYADAAERVGDFSARVTGLEAARTVSADAAGAAPKKKK